MLPRFLLVLSAHDRRDSPSTEQRSSAISEPRGGVHVIASIFCSVSEVQFNADISGTGNTRPTGKKDKPECLQKYFLIKNHQSYLHTVSYMYKS